MTVSRKMQGCVLVLCSWLTVTAWGQDFSRHNWYFGNNGQGIRFNRADDSASLITYPNVLGTGGSAVATDQTNANLLFYTNGVQVFDVSDAQMPNGFGLTGNPSRNQPVAICPVPGQPNQYYVFTNNANVAAGGTVSFSIVDMGLFGTSVFPAPPIGDVTLKNQAFGMAANSRSEAMITIPHTNGTDFWLITHQNGTDIYTVTQVQAAGAFTHTDFSNLTGGLDISAANFAYDSLAGRIAVTPQTADRNVIILDFDNATGNLSFNQFVFNSAHNVAESIYDTEWSSNSQFLYISRLNDTGTDAQVLQFNLLDPVASLAPVLPSNVFRSYGLQMAPDSAIYHLYEEIAGVFRLGRMTNTDTLAAGVNYSPMAFPSNPDFDARQFPSFSPTQNITLTVSFITAGTCSMAPTSFYPTVTPTADSLVWTFGDGFGSSDWSPIHTYQDGPAFTVTVTAFLNGQTATSSQTINITEMDLQLNLVQDTTACECELPVNNNIPPCPNDTSDDFSVEVDIQGNPTSIIWSNGDTGATLTPDSAGYYYVVVTDPSGCVAHAGVNIREYGLQDQRANIWYFGQNAGINFNTPPGTTAISGPINSPEGVAVISDRNGQVVFSTDGVRVYDRNDNEIVIPVPPGIGGEPGSTQSALIIPVPGDETLYYIFTTQEVHGTNTYELRYSLYDVKLNSGDGGLAQFNQLLFTRSTERITGNGNWLIAHEYGNNSFRAYPITSAGIGNPVISSIGSDHVVTDANNGQGYMKLGANNRLAVAFSTLNVSNVIEIFDFNNATGEITNFRSVDLNSPTGQVYGIEFAGQKLLATIKGSGTSFIREVYFDFQGNPVLITPSAPGESVELGAIQLGPNGQLYVAVNGQPFLGTIIFNPDTLALSSFLLNGFPLAGGTESTLGLPNFIQNVGNAIQPAGMQVAGFCLGSPTFFAGFGTDPIDEFTWSFGDGFGSDSAMVQHTYAAAGLYTVTLRVFNRCGLDTLIIQDITIYAPPANPTFLPAGVLQPVICNGSLTLEATPATNPDLPNLTFLWSTGETTRTIDVSVTSLVSVTITNTVSGCTSGGSLIVADNRPQVELGPDQTLCQNTPVFPLNAQNPGTRYEWFINNTPSGTAQTQPVDSSVPGTFEYKVQVTDDLSPFSTGCTIRDSVVFVFNESPVFTAIPSNTTACGTNTGQIALTLITPATTLFTYFVTGPATSLTNFDQSAGPVLPVFGSLGAGTYGVTVTDQISGCTSITTVGISDNVIAITSTVAQSPTCDPIPIDVVTTGVISFVGATYTITDSGTGALVVAPTPFAAANFTTAAVPVPGSYTVQINAQGCVATRNISVVSDPQVPIGLIADGCSNPITVTALGATGFTWSGPNITSSNLIGTITATPPQGPQTYTVTATAPGQCPTTSSIVVEVNNNVSATFAQTDACEDQVTLTADPTGSYTYRWFRNGVQIPGGQSIIAGLADNGINYRVEVVNTVSGCVFSSPTQTVFVAGDLQLAMTTTIPCTGTPFTLTGTTNIPGTGFQWGLDGVDLAGATLPTLTRIVGGLYRLTGTLPGCSEFIEQEIILFPTTAGSLPSRALICPNVANPDPNTREVFLDAGPGFISYTWLQGGVILPGVTGQTYTATEEGLFQVQLMNSFGCPSTDQTEVIEECNPRIVAPNAFRPGSQVVSNTNFGIFTFFIDDEDFEVFIFNRWGEMVYQSNDLLFKWNGGYNNNAAQLLPAGTYTYIVKYKSSYRPEDGIQETRGGVVLLR